MRKLMGEFVKLIFGDCIEEMKKLPGGSVDMVLVDPPFGTISELKKKWDKIIELNSMWNEILRVTKEDSPIVFHAAQPFTTTLISSNMEMFRYCWVWDKHIARGMHRAKFQPMRKHEDIVVFSQNKTHNYFPIMVKRDKPVTVKNYAKDGGSVGKYKDNSKTYTYTHKNPTSIILGCWEANKGKLHPTQKPVSLLEYLIKTYTLEEQTVLDFTMGSGSTGVACQNLNRKFIGIENNSEYFEIAKARIENA